MAQETRQTGPQTGRRKQSGPSIGTPPKERRETAPLWTLWERHGLPVVLQGPGVGLLRVPVLPGSLGGGSIAIEWTWTLTITDEDGGILYKQTLTIPAGNGVRMHPMGWFEEMRPR